MVPFSYLNPDIYGDNGSTKSMDGIPEYLSIAGQIWVIVVCHEWYHVVLLLIRPGLEHVA